jgi:hypothetical protein
LLGLRLAVVTTAYCSQTARYNRLIEDVRNDVMRVDPFFRSARYVVDMDRGVMDRFLVTPVRRAPVRRRERAKLDKRVVGQAHERAL